VTLQEAPPFNVWPLQPSPTTANSPVAVPDPTVSAVVIPALVAVPVFERTKSVFPPGLPAAEVGKTNEPGLRLKVGVPVPLPMSVAVADPLPGAVTVNDAPFAPALEGLITTLKLHDAPGASDVPLQPSVTENSAASVPALVVSWTLREPELPAPAFVTTNGSAALDCPIE